MYPYNFGKDSYNLVMVNISFENQLSSPLTTLEYVITRTAHPDSRLVGRQRWGWGDDGAGEVLGGNPSLWLMTISWEEGITDSER